MEIATLDLDKDHRCPEKKDFQLRNWKTLKQSLGKLLGRRSVTITEYDPVYKVVYLGNVLTGWAKGDSCAEKPLNTLWKNYTTNSKPDVQMKLTITQSGLKAITKEHGLTEYWSHRVTYCYAPREYPRIFCWIYRHEGRKLKQELRCHAVLCAKESVARLIAAQLQVRLTRALIEFKRDKISRQNARLSLANCVYDNPSMPRRKILLSTGCHNYRPPLERSKSAPKLMSIEECIEEEEDSHNHNISNSGKINNGTAPYTRSRRLNSSPTIVDSTKRTHRRYLTYSNRGGCKFGGLNGLDKHRRADDEDYDDKDEDLITSRGNRVVSITDDDKVEENPLGPENDCDLLHSINKVLQLRGITEITEEQSPFVHRNSWSAGEKLRCPAVDNLTSSTSSYTDQRIYDVQKDNDNDNNNNDDVFVDENVFHLVINRLEEDESSSRRSIELPASVMTMESCRNEREDSIANLPDNDNDDNNNNDPDEEKDFQLPVNRFEENESSSNRFEENESSSNRFEENESSSNCCSIDEYRRPVLMMMMMTTTESCGIDDRDELCDDSDVNSYCCLDEDYTSSVSTTTTSSLQSVSSSGKGSDSSCTITATSDDDDIDKSRCYAEKKNYDLDSLWEEASDESGYVESCCSCRRHQDAITTDDKIRDIPHHQLMKNCLLTTSVKTRCLEV